MHRVFIIYTNNSSYNQPQNQTIFGSHLEGSTILFGEFNPLTPDKYSSARGTPVFDYCTSGWVLGYLGYPKRLGYLPLQDDGKL